MACKKLRHWVKVGVTTFELDAYVEGLILEHSCNLWTGLTIEGELSAHFDHSIAITKEGPFILGELESNNNK